MPGELKPLTAEELAQVIQDHLGSCAEKVLDAILEEGYLPPEEARKMYTERNLLCAAGATLIKEADQRGFAFLKDGACAECFHGDQYTVAGFKCARHRIAAIAMHRGLDLARAEPTAMPNCPREHGDGEAPSDCICVASVPELIARIVDLEARLKLGAL